MIHMLKIEHFWQKKCLSLLVIVISLGKLVAEELKFILSVPSVFKDNEIPYTKSGAKPSGSSTFYDVPSETKPNQFYQVPGHEFVTEFAPPIPSSTTSSSASSSQSSSSSSGGWVVQLIELRYLPATIMGIPLN